MSVIWGNKAENNNFVLGYEIVYNNTDVYVDFWVWTRVSIADTVNTFTCQLTGATPYQGSVEIHTNSNTEWSYQNQKFIYRAVTTTTKITLLLFMVTYLMTLKIIVCNGLLSIGRQMVQSLRETIQRLRILLCQWQAEGITNIVLAYLKIVLS